MQKSCQYCGKTHKIGEICPKKPQKTISFKKHNKASDKFRGKQAWKNKRHEIRERDMNVCRLCLTGKYRADGRPAIVTDNLSVHHIIPLETDRNYGLENDWLITLCSSCHELAEAGKVSAEYLHSLAMKTDFINNLFNIY